METAPSDSNVAVDIVLATYNGAAHLAAQLASIEAQRGPSWRLLVADDGSTDGTLAVIEAFRGRQPPERVVLLPPVSERFGPSQAFGRLLAATSAPLVCLCDQDDVWHPDKLQETTARLAEVEAASGGAPCLVHCDLELVDERTLPISPSLNRYQHLRAQHRTGLRQLLVQNAVTGCTVVMNRRLVELALPIPTEAIMHDWWLAIVAASFGQVSYIPKALVKYRQHGKNTLGARRFRPDGGGHTFEDMRLSLSRTYAQAEVLVDRFGTRLPVSARLVAEGYAEMRDLGPVSRRLRMVTRGYAKAGCARNVGMFCVM